MADTTPCRWLPSCLPRGWRPAALKVVLRLLVMGLLLGWLYAWVGPRLYPPDRVPGFGWGMAHGACMPMALPALLMGQDVSIFAPRNTGRGYKLGYIAGINLCGLVFFGGAFWKPGRPVPPEPQHHHER